MPRVSVLMPTYGQAAFLPRAVASLLAQDLRDWQLVIVDDGSPDHTARVVGPLLGDSRIAYHRLAANGGLGAALNVALDRSDAALVAYLPSDDVLRRDHLSTLVGLLADHDAVLAHGARRPPGATLQLVQVAHRRTPDRWTERDELESDDLERLLFARLRARGRVVGCDRVTCEWTQHPGQRHRAIREGLDGGLNVFRHRYRVTTPLRLAPSDGALVDEHARYARWRGRPARRAPEGLRILLAGELAYNPDRIVALEDRGHELLGLWTDDPLSSTTVGPLPFGHVRDLPRHGWRAAVRAERPDVIYALLNWRAVPLAHEVLSAGLGIPFVFHFKEAPQRCIARGEWAMLVDVVTRADACIFASEEERDWFHAALPSLDPGRTHAMDGDLPKAEWLDGRPQARLSECDGALHTALVGRPYGWSQELGEALRRAGVHVHVHAGPTSVGPERWVEALSRYDAGWMHPVTAANGGDVRAATWDDLNLPARIPTLLAAGLPLIVPRNPPGAVHAVERFVTQAGVGVLYDDVDELVAGLRDRPAMERRRGAAWRVRSTVTFDHHVDRLVDILATTARAAPRGGRSRSSRPGRGPSA